MTKEINHFQTEVNQLLHLVIHSLYSNKEIFLRELISNASDAADKLRFCALNDESLYEGDAEFKIRVEVDLKEKKISVIDNGIGMDFDEVKTNLGTIAQSGTRNFLSNLTGTDIKDSNLIGQFGVGFYSAFIVAKRVVVKTRKAGVSSTEGVIWSSEGENGFSVDKAVKTTRGTEVILYLRDTEHDFLSDWKLRSIVTKYSDHICWPIQMKKVEIKDAKEQEKDEIEYETVNKAKALWTLNGSDISTQDYNEFYKHISHDSQDPLMWSHNHIEGRQQYTAMLYIPSHTMFDIANREAKHGLKLYVHRVFIMDDADQFLPQYLRFVKGIIDSNDLPLNVSRELLQHNKFVEKIKRGVSKKVISLLEKLAKDQEKYDTFWKTFGLVLKEGIIEDAEHKDKLAKLMRFATNTSDSEKQEVSFDDYLKRMNKDQETIYYVTASSYNAAKNGPQLEYFNTNNIEVILFYDHIDEWLVSHLPEYQGKKLVSVTRGKLHVSNEEDKQLDDEIKKAEPEYKEVLDRIKQSLGQKVKEVRISSRLTKSPACLIVDENDMGREMKRLLEVAGHHVPPMSPILEINPTHTIIKTIKSESNNDRFNNWVNLIYDQAVLAEGGQLDNPSEFVSRLNDIILTLTLNAQN